jgi:hypothetical protein
LLAAKTEDAPEVFGSGVLEIRAEIESAMIWAGMEELISRIDGLAKTRAVCRIAG